MDSLSMSAVSGIEGANDATVSSKVRQFKCQYCSKDFDRYSHLARHLKIHSGLRPFECKYCHKSFSRSDNLIKHVRIHTGDKRYGCEFCLKRFTDSSNLSKHMRTHAGTRRYTCTLCSKTFRKSDTLRRHLLTHGVSDGNGSAVAADDGNGGSGSGGGGGGSSTDNGSGEVALRDNLSVGGHDRRGSSMDASGDTASLLSLSDAAAAAADVQRRLQMQNILHIINKERSFPTMTTSTVTATTTATTADVSNLQGAQLQSQLQTHPRSRLPSVSKSEAKARGTLGAIGEPSNEARLLGPDAGATATKSSYTGNLLQWSDGEEEEIVKAPPKNTTAIATDVFSRTDHIIRQLSQTNENIQVYNSNNTSSSSSSKISKMKLKQNRMKSVNHVGFDFDQLLSYSANAATLLPNPVGRKASASSRSTAGHSVDRFHHVNSLGRARNRFPITFQCSYCGMQFFSRTSLEMHVKGHVDDCAEEGKDVAPFRIKNEYDDDKLGQVNHINTLLGNISEDVSKIHVKRRLLENHGSMDLFQTSRVGGATSFKDLHVGSAGPPYECLYCKAAFPRALALADHLKCHIRRRLECKNCGESFSSSVRLSKHRRQCPAQDRNQRSNRSKNRTDLVQQRLVSARLVGGQPQFDHHTMAQDDQGLNPDRRFQLSAGDPVSSVVVVNPSAPKLKQEIILSDSEMEDDDTEDDKKEDSIKDPGNSMLLQHGLNVLDGIGLSTEDLTGLSQNGEREAFDALGMVKKKRRQGNDFGSSLRNTACKEKETQGQQEQEETGKLMAISGNESTVEVDAIVAKILSKIGQVSECDFRRVIKQEVKETGNCRDRKGKEVAVGGISTSRSFQNLMSVDQISLNKSKIFARNTTVLTDDNDDDVGPSMVDRYSSVAVPQGVVLKTETGETLVSVVDDGGDDSQVTGFGSVSHMEVSNRASPTDDENFSSTPQKQTSMSVSGPSTPSAETPTPPVSRVATDSKVKVKVKKEASVPPCDRSVRHDDSIRIPPSRVHTAPSKDLGKGDSSGVGPLTKASSDKETLDVEIVNTETGTTTAASTTITTTTTTTTPTTTTTTKYDDHDNNSYQSTSSCNSSSNNSCSSTTTTVVTTSSSRGSTAATHTSSTTASAAISTATSAAFNTTSAAAVDSTSPVISASATSTTTTTTTASFSAANLTSSAANLTSSAASLTSSAANLASSTANLTSSAASLTGSAANLTSSAASLTSSAANLTSSAAANDKKDGSVRSNGNIKEFSCKYCRESASSLPVSFSSALDLTQHLRWCHLVHACSVCWKNFSKSTQLNRHLKIHAGIKPFRCAYCDRAFSRSDNLVKHVRIHTGDKRYSCSICTKRFTDSSNLTKHLRTHARAAAATATAASGGATAPSKSNSSRSGNHSNSNHSFPPPHTSTGSSERDDDDDSRGDDDNSYESRCFLSRQQQQNPELRESGSPLLPPSTELSPFRCMLCSKPFDNSIALHRHLLTHAKLGQSPPQLKTLLLSETTSPSPPPSPQQHLPLLPYSVPSSSATDLRSISAAVARAAVGTTNINTTTTTSTTTTTAFSVIPQSPPQSSSSLLSLSLQSMSSSAKNATSALKKTFGSGPTALLQRFKKQLRDKLYRCHQCGKVFLDESTLANHIYRFHITTITAASLTVKDDGEENDEEMEEEEMKEEEDVGEDEQTGLSEHGQTAPVASQQNMRSPVSVSRGTSSGTLFSKTSGASLLAIPGDPNCRSLCNVSPFMLDYIKQEVLEEEEDEDGNQEEEDEAAGNTTLTVVGGFKVEMDTEMDDYLYSGNNNPNPSDPYNPHHHHHSRLHPYINNSDNDDDDDNDDENNSSHQSHQHQQHLRTHRRLHDSDHHPRNRLFHCSRCQIFFSGVEELTHHLKLHTTGEMFRCKECGELIQDLNMFNDHLLRDCQGSSSNNTNSFTDTVSLGGNKLTGAVVSHDDEMDSRISDVNSLTSGNDLTNSVSKPNSILSSTASDIENLTTAITNSDGSSNTNISLGHHNSISSVSKTDISSSAVSETESLTNAVTNTSGSSDSNITSASHNLTESTSEDSAKLPLQNQLDVQQNEAKARSSIVVSSERSVLLSSSSSPWHLQFSSPLPSASSSPSAGFGPASSGQDPGSDRAASVPSLSSPGVQVQRQAETTAEIRCGPNDLGNRGDDDLRTADGSSCLVSAPRNNMVTTVASTTTTTTINVNSCSNNNNNNNNNNNENYNSNRTINDNNNHNNFQESSAENFPKKSLVDPFQENLSLAVKQEFVLPDGSAMKQEPKTPEPDGQQVDGYRTSTASGSVMELFPWRGGDGGVPLIPSLPARVCEIPQGRGQFEAENSCGSVGGISRADIKQEVDIREGPMVGVAEGKDVVEDGNLNTSEPFQRSASSDNADLLAGTVSLNENFVFPSTLDDEELKDINFKFPSAIDAAEELKNIDLKFSSENTIDELKDINFKSQGVRLSYDLLNTTRNSKDAHHTDVAGFYSNADQEPSNSYYDGNGNFRKGTAMVPDKQPEAEKCIQEFLLFDEFVEFRNKNYFSGANGGPESTLVADQKCKTNNVICISDSNSNSAMSLSDDDGDDDDDGDVPLTSDGPNYRNSMKNLGFTMTVVPAGSTNTHHADNVMMKQTEDLKDVFENVNVKLEDEEEEEMSQPCASDILVSSLPEGGFEVDNSNSDVSRVNKFPPSQWESNQNDRQFRDAMLDFLSSLSDETLQLLLQKGDKWCDELLHHTVTAAWKPAAATNMDCLPSDVAMTLSARENEAGICEDYEDVDNHMSVDAAERKSQNLSNQVAADLIMADRPDNTSSYNNAQFIQHDGNKQSSLMTAKATPTGSMDAVDCKELNQESRTLKENLSQPLPNSLSFLSCLQPAENNLDFPKPFIKIEPEFSTDSDCSAMVPISSKIKTEDLSKFSDAIFNADELASLLSGNQLPALNNVREMLIERDLSLKSKRNSSHFLGNVFADQLDNDADRKVTFSELNDNHHELLSSSLPLSSFPSLPADESAYRSNSPSSVGQPFLLNTLNLASFTDKGQTANASAIDILARNCGLQLDKPSYDADTMKRHWQQQQQKQQDQQTATTTTTAMMPTDHIAPSTTTSLIKALQRKQQQLPRHGGAQSTAKQYTCPQYDCRKMFTRPSHLKRHLKVHAGLKPFPCPHCHKWFSRSDNLTKHIRIHTGEKLFSCNFCQKRFSDSSNLTKHVRTHTGEKPYRCVYCSQTFTESRTLSRHMRTHSLMMMMMMEMDMDMVGGAGGRASCSERM
ncbi:uncharacterized protein LOC115225209 isoform X2 [Octopus sinensis]|uniref:Uncharacterized protein LOC115225209 isoform X2 n=1 Tax=Octopus sinensis TaxID=2607531 RepID=A0A7E6FQM3_9MOLL|nr:uncharacterized protein LOC115225209 isoform X2 [Octopus sinensis]